MQFFRPFGYRNDLPETNDFSYYLETDNQYEDIYVGSG